MGDDSTALKTHQEIVSVLYVRVDDSEHGGLVRYSLDPAIETSIMSAKPIAPGTKLLATRDMASVGLVPVKNVEDSMYYMYYWRRPQHIHEIVTEK